jgi:hypothetical protein
LPALAKCPNPDATLRHLLAARELLQGEKVERLSRST